MPEGKGDAPHAGTRVDTVWGELVFTPAEAADRDAPGPAGADDELLARARRHARERERRRADGGARADRAAQFMPFAALRGYYELTREAERVREPRHEPTEEEALALSRTVEHLKRGDRVRVVHYDRDAYVATTGAVGEVDLVGRVIRIVRRPIALDDIRSIEVID